MEMKTLLNWLSYSLISLFSIWVFNGCNKNKYDSPFGDLKTGKYEITVYKQYPSGAKDTLTYLSYGPRNFFDVASFDVITSGSKTTWAIYYNNKELRYLTGGAAEESVHKMTSIEHTSKEVKISFAPYIIPPPPETDSAYGTAIFKYIQL